MLSPLQNHPQLPEVDPFVSFPCQVLQRILSHFVGSVHASLLPMLIGRAIFDRILRSLIFANQLDARRRHCDISRDTLPSRTVATRTLCVCPKALPRYPILHGSLRTGAVIQDILRDTVIAPNFIHDFPTLRMAGVAAIRLDASAGSARV